MKFSKRRILMVAAIAVASSIGAAFAYHNLNSEAGLVRAGHAVPSDSRALHPNGSELVVRAFTVPNGWGASRAKHAFTGTLQPRYQTAVAFRVSGKLLERKVEVGQHVKKGDVLFRMDPEDIELQLRVAESDQISAISMLRQSTAEEARLSRLRSGGSVSQSEYDLGLANRDVAQARLDAADRRLALAKNQRTYCDLIADSDGLITAIQAEAGQVVNVGQAVLQLMQTNELEATVSLPENMVADIKKLRATATFWSRPELELQAELRELSPMADPATRTYDARFTIRDATSELAIGMTVSILLSDSQEEGICLPITSIGNRNEKVIVWRVATESGRVEAVPIEVLQYRTENVIVRGPIRSGDQIVSAGVHRIDENSTVRIWESRK